MTKNHPLKVKIRPLIVKKSSSYCKKWYDKKSSSYYKNRPLIAKNHPLIVKNVMTSNPISTNPDTLAAKALSIMNAKKITCLCVNSKKSKKKTIGIIHIHNILEANVN